MNNTIDSVRQHAHHTTLLAENQELIERLKELEEEYLDLKKDFEESKEKDKLIE